MSNPDLCGPDLLSVLAVTLGRELAHLDDESTTLNGVDKDVAGGEVGVVRPGTDEINDTTVGQGIVLGVDVEEGNLLDAGSSGISANG